MVSKKFLFVLILFCSQNGSGLPEIDDNLRQMIYDWAPVIWIHSDELFYPSTIEFFFDNTELRDENETVIQENPTRSTVMTGDETQDTHLNSIPDLPCPDCLLEWFVGEPLADVPVYVYLIEYDSTCGSVVDVTYRAFFPYNYGKDVCLGVEIGGNCSPADQEQSFGNHVGDWEGLSLRFINNEINSAFISTHSWGAGYAFNQTTNNFVKVFGEDIPSGPELFPETIELVEGTLHPEIFCANGSHGMWAQPGSFTYMRLPIRLVDECDRGEAWETWNYMEIIPYEEGYVYDGNYTYVDFEGRWGNLKDGCQVEIVSGECILVDAPGQRTFADFYEEYPPCSFNATIF